MADNSEVNVKPNANFTRLGGASIHKSIDEKYNSYRRMWRENPKKFIAGPFPIHLDIEATNRCNLKCKFCDKLPYLKAHEFGDMDYDLYKRIIDEGAEKGLCSVKLSYRGEPLLHNRIADMVGYARGKGILDIYFNTNAMLLTESMAKALIDAGLNRISISIEGTDKTAFERARVGAKFDRIKKNVQALLAIREKSNLDLPKVRMQTVALPGINLEEYAEYWAPFCDETAAIDYKDAVQRSEKLVASDWACPQLWQRMTIEWDGVIMACNNDDYRLLSPGNVNIISVEKCWHATLVNRARQLHQSGRSHEMKACNGCPWRTTQIMKQENKK